MPSYTKKQKKVAVELYIKYDKRAGQTMRELGYPNDRHTLRGWYREYEKDKDFHDRRKESRLGSGYTKEQMEASVRYYLEHGRNVFLQ